MNKVLDLIKGLDIEELLDCRDEKELADYLGKFGRTIDYVKMQMLKDYFCEYVDGLCLDELSDEQLDAVSGGMSLEDSETLCKGIELGGEVIALGCYCFGAVGVGMGISTVSSMGTSALSNIMYAYKGEAAQKYTQAALSQQCT